MDNTVLITLLIFSVFSLTAIISLYVVHLERTKVSYLKKSNQFKTLDLDVYIDFLKTLRGYVSLIKLYKLESPTKIGKVILISLNKLLSLVTEYNKSLKVVKDTDIIKPSDFKKIIEDFLKETIDVIEKDISIIKQKKLIQIVDMIKDINK